MHNDPRNLMPGDRVLVLDWRLFKDDRSTPLSFTVRPATVVRRYGTHSFWGLPESATKDPDRYPGHPNIYRYPDLVDVVFDHRLGEVSKGHFTDGVKEIEMTGGIIREFRGEFAFLSNFYPVRILCEGLEYPSVEHAYQAAKTHNLREKMMIRDTPSPGKAKRIGRKVHIREDWDSIRVGVMEGLLFQKFAESPLRDMLLQTGDQELVEGNDWGDTFWGVCGGVGENWLGKLLMKERKRIREVLGGKSV